jgi:hypothetical protein
VNSPDSALARPFLARLVRAAGLWAVLSLLFNLPWEIAQLPFYTLVATKSAGDVAYAIVHCTVGDMLIAAAVFSVTCGLLRRTDWPQKRPVAGWSLVTILGLVYTAWSEWRNVYQLGSWAYSADMPLVMGIGLSPLLQWLLIPAATLLVVRIVYPTGRTTRTLAQATRDGTDFPHHAESSVIIPVSADRLFAFADDFSLLSAHMDKSSWMMGGGSMHYELDDGRGQRVGSLVRMSGRVMGIQLELEERIVERQPPLRKVWETTGLSRLLVIGQYRLGFEIECHADGSHFRVFIDYSLPEKIPGRLLGIFFGSIYARWCTRRMVDDATIYFKT